MREVFFPMNGNCVIHGIVVKLLIFRISSPFGLDDITIKHPKLLFICLLLAKTYSALARYKSLKHTKKPEPKFCGKSMVVTPVRFTMLYHAFLNAQFDEVSTVPPAALRCVPISCFDHGKTNRRMAFWSSDPSTTGQYTQAS